MKSRLSGLLFLAVCALWHPALAEPQMNPGYDGASTDAERGLGNVLKTAQKDKNLLDNLFDGRGKPGYQKTVDYSRYLTPGLMGKLAEAEHALVVRNCGGQYLPGHVCGFDHDPIRCARGDFSSLFFKTDTNNGVNATISFIDTRQPTQDVRVYQMVQANGKWRIDGISCKGSEF